MDVEVSYAVTFLGFLVCGFYLLIRKFAEKEVKLSPMRNFLTYRFVRHVLFQPLAYTVFPAGLIGLEILVRFPGHVPNQLVYLFIGTFVSVIQGTAHDPVALTLNPDLRDFESGNAMRRISAHWDRNQFGSVLMLVSKDLLPAYGLFLLRGLIAVGAFRAILHFGSLWVCPAFFAAWNGTFCVLAILVGRVPSAEKEPAS